MGCCNGSSMGASRVQGDALDTMDVELDGVDTLLGVDTVVAHVWRSHHPPTTLTATVVDADAAVVRVDLSPWLDTAAPGKWMFDVLATWGTGAELSFPSNGYGELRVRAAAPT